MSPVLLPFMRARIPQPKQPHKIQRLRYLVSPPKSVKLSSYVRTYVCVSCHFISTLAMYKHHYRNRYSKCGYTLNVSILTMFPPPIVEQVVQAIISSMVRALFQPLTSVISPTKDLAPPKVSEFLPIHNREKKSSLGKSSTNIFSH